MQAVFDAPMGTNGLLHALVACLQTAQEKVTQEKVTQEKVTQEKVTTARGTQNCARRQTFQTFRRQNTPFPLYHDNTLQSFPITQRLRPLVRFSRKHKATPHFM